MQVQAIKENRIYINGVKTDVKKGDTFDVSEDRVPFLLANGFVLKDDVAKQTKKVETLQTTD
jgi:hypothetical protein